MYCRHYFGKISITAKQGLVVKAARTKIDQNFLASKYDIEQHSDPTEE